MIRAFTFSPAHSVGGESTELVMYSSEKVTARTLLAAVKSVSGLGRPTYTAEIEIEGKRRQLRTLHEIAATYYLYRDGVHSLKACADVLKFVADTPARVPSRAPSMA